MDKKPEDIQKKEMSTFSRGKTVIWIAAVIVVIVIGGIYVFLKNNQPAPSATPPLKSAASVTNPNASPDSSTAVMIQNFAFSPATLEIKKGKTVTWTNEDSSDHQVASDTNVFSGSPLSKGQTYSFTFNETGSFPYHCVIHPSMKGTIIVK